MAMGKPLYVIVADRDQGPLATEAAEALGASPE